MGQFDFLGRGQKPITSNKKQNKPKESHHGLTGSGNKTSSHTHHGIFRIFDDGSTPVLRAAFRPNVPQLELKGGHKTGHTVLENAVFRGFLGLGFFHPSFPLRGRWGRLASVGEQAPSPSFAFFRKASLGMHPRPQYCK